jgi:hypothetical protein
MFANTHCLLCYLMKLLLYPCPVTCLVFVVVSRAIVTDALCTLQVIMASSHDRTTIDASTSLSPASGNGRRLTTPRTSNAPLTPLRNDPTLRGHKASSSALDLLSTMICTVAKSSKVNINSLPSILLSSIFTYLGADTLFGGSISVCHQWRHDLRLRSSCTRWNTNNDNIHWVYDRQQSLYDIGRIAPEWLTQLQYVKWSISKHHHGELAQYSRWPPSFARNAQLVSLRVESLQMNPYVDMTLEALVVSFTQLKYLIIVGSLEGDEYQYNLSPLLSHPSLTYCDITNLASPLPMDGVVMVGPCLQYLKLSISTEATLKGSYSPVLSLSNAESLATLILEGHWIIDENSNVSSLRVVHYEIQHRRYLARARTWVSDADDIHAQESFLSVLSNWYDIQQITLVGLNINALFNVDVIKTWTYANVKEAEVIPRLCCFVYFN